jgi:penicillin-binding protein 1C
MARKASKKQNEKLAQKFDLDLVDLILRGLSAVGKPIYFLLTRFVLLTVVVLSAVGHFFSASWSEAKKLVKPKKAKKRKTKKQVKKLKLPKIKLPKISLLRIKLPVVPLPDFGKIFRLEGLKIALFELKIIFKIRKFFGRKITKFQKFKLKKRVFIITVLFILVSFISYFYFFIFKTLPSPTELGNRTPEVSTKIYDRNGNLLYKIYRDENRSIVPLSQIPVHVRLATLAAEDAEFYDNPGFSVKGIIRAIIQNTQSGTLQGGSTITQQLVKNVLLTPEKTIIRKIKELVLAVEVEATYTKDEILEMYLNRVSYGGTAYGIEEAAQEYFGKNVGELDLSEAAFLAGLPQSPTAYSPYGQNPETGINRQKEVLHLMTVNKFITKEQEDDAASRKITFIPDRDQILAPHFVMYIRQLLVDKYGEDMVEKGGLEVTTSLDLPIQQMSEKVVKDEVEKLKGLSVGNGAALVVKPQTGEILAMVGSANYFNNAGGGQVNVTARLRQPGSSIKVVNYAYALSEGKYTPATLINDTPITYVTPGSPPYSPVNYDSQYIGNVSLRSALAQSRNIPAVKILASYGVSKMVTQGQKMGIESWNDPSKFGLSLTLGGGAVTALDMARVYSTLANYGKTPELMPILTVKNYKGKVLENNSPELTQSLDERVAFLLTTILSDNNARAPEFGFNSFLVVPGHPEVAVKTGTSNELRDNWTDGYSQDYLVIAWVGNNNNAPMSRIASGVTGASPIWNKIMSTLLKDKTSIDWKVPDGVSKVNCPGGKSEWFLNENILPRFCNPPPSPSPGPTGVQSQILEGAATISR